MEDQKPRFSRLAIASFGLGFVTTFFIIGFVLCAPWPMDDAVLWVAMALLLATTGAGLLATYRILRSGGRLRGLWLAQMVAILGIIATTGAVLAPVFLVPVHKPNPAASCVNHLKMLGIATEMYRADNGDCYPSAGRWTDSLMPYVEKMDGNAERRYFVCPKAANQKLPSYAMNRQLSGMEAGDVKSPAGTVSLYESVSGRDRAGGPELLPWPPRHAEVQSIAFVDGHARLCFTDTARALNWDPKAAVKIE